MLKYKPNLIPAFINVGIDIEVLAHVGNMSVPSLNKIFYFIR